MPNLLTLLDPLHILRTTAILVVAASRVRPDPPQESMRKGMNQAAVRAIYQGSFDRFGRRMG